MLFVTDYTGINTYRINNYHLSFMQLPGSADPTQYYCMVGYTDYDNKLVLLGYYKFYRQAIDVFAQMDYKENDLMYFKKTRKDFIMPECIYDEDECISVYGSTY